MGGVVREHEILRVAASIGGKDASESARAARREVLAWAQNRSGGRLPKQAWDFDSFEYLSGGRNSVGVRIQSPDSDIWAVRADDPDKHVPGRTWTTEVVVGWMQGQRSRFSVRLLASTSEDELAVEPHTPGLVQQVAETNGLLRGGYDLDAVPWRVEGDEDLDRLLDMLVDPDRALPIVVLTVPEGSVDSWKPLIDAPSLSRAILGIGHVAILPAEFTWALTDRFGRVRSVFGGAVRAYLAGFNSDSYPYDHRLVPAEELGTDEGAQRCARWMKLIAAAESVRRNRLDHDVLTFANIRNASLRSRQERLRKEGANLGEQLAAAQARISALEKNVEDEKAALEYFDSEAKRAEERAAAAETQHRASTYRIQQLLGELQAKGDDIEGAIAAPASWAEFANWCDVNMSGRVALAPAARRGIKSSEFEDLDLVIRCVRWLANDYRNGRINGSHGDFRDFYLESGVRNSPCGGDEFDLDWQGRRQTADWHIKNGGNTRDPRRCLRIYHFWEQETRQVIIADMPAHRSSIVS